MITFPNAKINLGLNILQRRPDGYHDISGVMIPAAWCDILEIVPAKGSTSTLTVTGRAVACPPESNLVMKAYRRLSEAIALPPVDIFLHKIIPDGAGLGGGSSDAAFTLTTLNTLFELDIDADTLAGIAATIGADCPFFIYNRPMLISGTGTTLTPIEVGQCQGKSLLIIKPSDSVSTARAYAGVTPSFPAKDIRDIIAQPIDTWQAELHNDFEPSVGQVLPIIANLKRQLYEYGAEYAAMSGSGSAVFGIFPDDKMAERASAAFDGFYRHVCPI